MREMLNGYVPFESRKVAKANEGASELGPTLEKVKSDPWRIFLKQYKRNRRLLFHFRILLLFPIEDMETSRFSSQRSKGIIF